MFINDDPVIANTLGKRVQNFNRDLWNKSQDAYMCTALLAKFSQDQELAHALLGIGTTLLVEASPYNKYWGGGGGGGLAALSLMMLYGTHLNGVAKIHWDRCYVNSEITSGKNNNFTCASIFEIINTQIICLDFFTSKNHM